MTRPWVGIHVIGIWIKAIDTREIKYTVEILVIKELGHQVEVKLNNRTEFGQQNRM